MSTRTTSVPSAELKRDLLVPGVELAETHISLVFLGEDEVWKVKKPLDLGFLDYSSLEKRHRACEAEVDLNRRLAASVYLGCVPIVRDDEGRCRLGGPGEAVEWAVHMRRLDDGRRADRLLEEGELTVEQIERVAERLVSFHAEAKMDEETSSFGTRDAIAFNVRENFEQTRETIGEYLSPRQAEEIEDWQTRFLDADADLFAARIEAGRVRDGHGDLRLEHVYLDADDRPTIIDCIEFNERFRFADVCADIAFLAMDLSWHGRVDLAERFLAAYARAANDYDLYPLVDFYESYRAFVRGKVASFLAGDMDADLQIRERAAREARRFFLLALASERRSLLPPMVVAVGGWIAAGKSTVADALAAELTAPVVDSDRTRKWLLDLAPRQQAAEEPWQGAYSDDVTEDVYAEVMRRAGAVLDSGRIVVLDASFRSRETRAAARRLAEERRLPFYFVECRADPEICRERLRRRDREERVTDGRLEIFDDFLERWQPADELPEEDRLLCDTSRPLSDCVEDLLARMPEADGRKIEDPRLDRAARSDD